ncbi:hypothetical protein DFH11DRAFT_1843271 [Phellopilus nigrolimitatus]|nr:hypothetical protein DFH11DRAFT_1843271 [Phellopilus nigrolimitatus]
MVNPYAPNLPADVLWLERATLIGDCMSFVTYGVSFVVFLLTTYALLEARKRSQERLDWTLLIYTCMMFSLGTIFIGMSMRSFQLMFIDNRDFPGGPTAYALSQYSSAITIVPNACSIISGWLADGFLLFRCLVIFRLRFYVVALPILMYLGSITMGIMVLFQSSRPGANLWSKVSVNFGVPYFSLSMALNILVTLLIATRLLLYRRKLHRTLGPEQVAAVPYVTIAAMIVESSMLYAVFSLLFIGPYGANSQISHIFLPILSQVQSYFHKIIAPMLIIFRVAKRRAWDRRTATAPLSSMQFETVARQTSNSALDPSGDTNAIQLGLEDNMFGKESGNAHSSRMSEGSVN